MIQLDIRGMHCAGCAGAVEGALRRVPHVTSATVNLATERATVEVSGPAATDALLAAVRAAGYDARPHESLRASHRGQANARLAELRGQRRRLVLAALLATPIIIPHLALGIPILPDSVRGLLEAWSHGAAGLWLQFVLAGAIVSVAAGGMVAGAARALISARANMDLLVSLGSLTAVGSSLVGIVLSQPGLIHLDSAVTIVLFVSLGKYLESRARGRASAALEAILNRIPATAERLTFDNQRGTDTPQTVSIDDIRPGDRLRLTAHAPVPVDGEIVVGSVTVDESMLTGESQPIERGVGSLVSGGTRVADGAAEMRVTAPASESAAARVARLVEQAQATRTPWHRLADRAAGAFVPIVVALALVTLLGWAWLGSGGWLWAIERMIAVLVVACPCALGLAIPTAVLVGTTRAAQTGILVRDAAALEAAGRVRQVLLDKTGTLTLGRPRMVAFQIASNSAFASSPATGAPTGDANSTDNVAINALLARAAAVASLSPHPLSQALARAALDRGLNLPPVSEFSSVPGAGLSGITMDQTVRIGNEAWAGGRGVGRAPLGESADSLAAAGNGVVWILIDGAPAAIVAFDDELHPQAADAVRDLKNLGVRVRLLSGDKAAACSALARKIGIDEFEGELSPEQKLERIHATTGDGPVAMVGDGINDAPALAAADVGIAIGTGADVAREAADICLMSHAPGLIAVAIRLSRASARVMKQNLVWAFAYNVVMLPTAMLAPLPPAAATAAMMFSSLSVVLNSLRLRRIALPR